MELVPISKPQSDPFLQAVVRRRGAEAWSVDWVDESLIAGCARDGAVWLCRIEDGGKYQLEVLGFHETRDEAGEPRRAAALGVASLGAGVVASCGDDGAVCLWDIANHERLQAFTGHGIEVQRAPFSGVRSVIRLEDGRIASCGGDKTVRIWQRGRTESLAELSTGERPRGLAVMTDGRIAYCGDSGLIGVWDYETGEDHRLVPPSEQPSRQDFRKIPHHVGHVMAIVAFGDGRLVTAGQDRTIRLWDWPVSSASVPPSEGT